MKQLFTFLFSILLLGNSSAQEKPVSTEFGIFSSKIEKEFNKRNTQIDINTNISIVLNFDSLGHFFLLDSSAYYPKEAFAMAKLLKELDRKKGILSQNPIFGDTSLIYKLTTLMDSEFQRAWLTRISTKPKSENYYLFDSEGFYVPPQPPGGFFGLLNYLISSIKDLNLEYLFSEFDTPWISFLIADDGLAIDAKVNGDPNADIQSIFDRYGKWTPGINFGYPTHTLYKIQISKKINDSIPSDIKKIAAGQLMEDILTGIPYKDYLLVREYLDQEALKRDDRLIVSFIYQRGLTEIIGPITLKGSKRKGKKLLKLINKHIAQSSMKKFPGPSRVYIYVDENKMPKWPSL